MRASKVNIVAAASIAGLIMAANACVVQADTVNGNVTALPTPAGSQMVIAGNPTDGKANSSGGALNYYSNQWIGQTFTTGASADGYMLNSIAVWDQWEQGTGYTTGYVETMMGRKCFAPGILDKNFGMRQFAERQAINAPLQGSNADIIKKAMILMDAFLKKGNYQSKLLLQVHDELIFEMPEGEIEILSPHIKRIMENVVHLKVPLLVDTSKGYTWAEV